MEAIVNGLRERVTVFLLSFSKRAENSE